MYIDDFSNNCIRKVTVSTGFITTVAGTCSTNYGFSGDGGAATSALLRGPQGVAVDSAGNIYISDTVNNRIRKVTVSTGIITTIAGSSTSTGFGGDGDAATSALFYYPVGIALDSAGL